MQDSLYICSIITKQVIYGKDHCIFKSEGWCRQEYFVLSLCPLPRSKEPESCCARCRPFPQHLTFRVKDGVAIQRLSTLYAQDQYQEAATAGAFNAIYEVVR